jgi:hypothetical protein
MRCLVAFVAVAGCAGDGLLHSEPLVRRATCSGDGWAVFGYPVNEADCNVQIFSLGDGCYVSNRPGERRREPRQVNHTPTGDRVWGHHLYQCDTAAAPDGHIACEEDVLPSRDRGGEEPQGIVARTRVPDMPGWYVDTAIGRCRERFHDWEAGYIPRPDRVTVETRGVERMAGRDIPTGNRVSSDGGELALAEDGLELELMAGPTDITNERAVTAHVCHDDNGTTTVDIPRRYPSRFEHELRDLFVSAMSSWRVGKPCAWLALHYRVKT